MEKKDVLAELPPELRGSVKIVENKDSWEVTHAYFEDDSTFNEIKDALTRLGGKYFGYYGGASHYFIPRSVAEEPAKGVAPALLQMENQKITPKEPADEPYSLKKSSKSALGKLYPVLKDAQGNVIDGFHRQKIDPEWPSIIAHNIDTPVKLELARLASNFCRRQVPKEELEEKIGFLIGAGLKPQKIADETGISLRTIYRYMPPELKKPEAQKISQVMREKSEAGKKELPPVSSYPTTQEMVQCEACPLGTTEPKQWHGHTLCPDCYSKALLKPEVFLAKFNRLPPEAVKPNKAVKAWKETAEHRRAVMHPAVSKFDRAFDVEAAKAGLPHGESQVEICIAKTRPDKRWFLPKGQLVAYWDGPVHKGREDRDEKLRDFLRKNPNIQVLEYDYETPTDKAVNEAVELARAKLLEMGWKNKHE